MISDEQVMKAFEHEDKVEFTEMEVSENMNQTATGEKKVSIRGLGDVILKYPTRRDEMDADNERSKAYTRFLMDDSLRTEEEMKTLAEKRGLWTEKDEQKMSQIQEKMLQLQIEISTTSLKGNAKKKKQASLLQSRREFLELVERKNNIFSHTVESKATNVWWQFLVFRCTFDEKDKRVWSDYGKFLEESASNAAVELIAEYIAFYSGFADNFFDTWLGVETDQPEDGETDGV